ncbi:MAG: Fic/DOC family protein [Ancrocorticia sp.]|uniref:Fic/DOC family protein n=1 Tax=Ancrocorticia sp. TaxID=2593684 RepID=UPI003F93847D
MTSFDTWESYFYPETYDWHTGQGVLRNLLGERDAAALARREYVRTSVRAEQLLLGLVPISRTYDSAHIRSIHYYLFQDVYEWAGDFRNVEISKGMSNFADAGSGQINRYLGDAHKLIIGTSWDRLDREAFGTLAATVFAYVNQAHPFREGNGRTSKVFMEHVAEQSKFAFDFARVTPEVWNNASMLSGPDRGQYAPVPDSLVSVFQSIAVERTS